MFNYFKILTILLITSHCYGSNFVIVADENSFFRACDSQDDGGNTKISDLLELNLNNKYADDMETLITNGNITVKFGLPDDVSLMLDLELLAWKRGKWEKTVYSMRRNDFCKAMFDPSEIWYSLTSQIPEKDRVCPPKKGIVYHFNNLQNRVELNNVHGLDLEGQYKVIAHFVVDAYSTCITAVVNIWKN